jgi:arsenate reductase (thioredoxin)
VSAPSLPLLPDQRLAPGVARLGGRVSPETVHALLTDSCSLPATTAQVRTDPVVPAERFTAERLGALALVQGDSGSGLPRELFVCSRDAGRSQLAAALPAAGRVTVSCAGTHPAGEVEPFGAQVLTEAGVDAAGAFPKPLTDEVVQATDTVITMGSGDACPVLSCPVRPPISGLARRRPDGAPLTAVRGILDVIDAHITGLRSCLPA